MLLVLHLPSKQFLEGDVEVKKGAFFFALTKYEGGVQQAAAEEFPLLLRRQEEEVRGRDQIYFRKEILPKKNLLNRVVKSGGGKCLGRSPSDSLYFNLREVASRPTLVSKHQVGVPEE